MRVTVNADGPPELVGKSGTVCRVLIRSSYEAWVNMDEAIPESVASFEEGDSRRNHVCLSAEEVEAEVKPQRANAGCQ